MNTTAPNRFGFGWPPVIAIGLIAMIGLVGVLPARRAAPAQVLSSRSLLMLPQSGGALKVVDARTDRVISTIPGVGDNFVRGVQHTLQTVRARYGVAVSAPYRLQSLSDGRLTLTDPGTRSVIDIESFGSANVAAFRALLDGAA